MLKIIRSKKYKKQYKKLKLSGNFPIILRDELVVIIEKLASNQVLDKKYQDHKLTGYKQNIREFHLRPDILVTYLKEKEKLILTLIEIGKHSNLFN